MEAESTADGGTAAGSAEGTTGTTEPRAPDAAAETDEGIQAILKDESTQSIMKYHVSVFAIVGVGLLLIGAVAPDIGAIFGLDEMTNTGTSQMGGDMLGMFSGAASEALVGVFALLFMFIAGPFVAAVTGIVSGLRDQGSAKKVAIGAGVGSFLGYLVMFVLVLFLGGTGIPVSPEFGATLSNGIPASIPAGLVASGTAYATLEL